MDTGANQGHKWVTSEGGDPGKADHFDMTVTELSEKLGISVTSCVADGYELLDKFLGGE